jgi:hypothetical protein
MRNTTFMTSMVLSVACVSAANAGVIPGFVSIDDFEIDSIADGATDPDNRGAYTYASGAYGAADVRQTFGGGRTGAANTGEAWGITTIGSGAMTMSYGGLAASPSTGAQNFQWENKGNWNDGVITDQPAPRPAVQTAQALFATATTFDWSGGTNFSFDISGYTTGGVSTYNLPKLTMFAYDQLGNFASKVLALANGHVDVNFSEFSGIDFSQLDYVAFQFENTYTAKLPKNTSGIPTGSVTITNFGYVPAPGAIALLGAAGLVGARRRRA